MKGWLADAWTRARARSSGRLRTSRLVSETVAAVSTIRYHIPVGSQRSRLVALLRACKRTAQPALQAHLARQLAPWLEPDRCAIWRQQGIGIERYYAGFGGIQKKALTTSLLIKEPGPDGEKGVLYSSFEYNWLRLVKHHDARAFFQRYYLVGASSGAPPDFAAFAHLAGYSPDPVFVGISNLDQIQSFAIASPVIRAVPLMACDWVDPDFYAPKSRSARAIDIVMVANWLRLKRHWLLFEALRTMRQDLRIVLIGRNAVGRTEAEIRREAKAFGVRQELELYTNIPADEVGRYLCDARISLLFSDREGSCVAPVESFFANTPVAMMRDAHVGSKAYINAQTGILAERRGLGRTLSRFLERSDEFRAREWAMERITCIHSSRRLNDILRDYARSAGHAWTRDITPLTWRYVPSYLHTADETRMEPAVRELEERYGIELVKFRYHPSSPAPAK